MYSLIYAFTKKGKFVYKVHKIVRLKFTIRRLYDRYKIQDVEKSTVLYNGEKTYLLIDLK